ncbi:hypothetical protein PCL_08628 [Purpureocillium lilacinum]|uniref:Uncharacterized protein n=1 Tax=Purpureocillium lilacinum TaxID=33203 RepID=A0A2U3DR26_PURLI|nr:hypothetical protein C2W62_10255 [Candidatus Entotheonella serta]PWI64702.1 hypothetical protein PCL_08628 [Purpureocillium lilacinum]
MDMFQKPYKDLTDWEMPFTRVFKNSEWLEWVSQKGLFPILLGSDMTWREAIEEDFKTDPQGGEGWQFGLVLGQKKGVSGSIQQILGAEHYKKFLQSLHDGYQSCPSEINGKLVYDTITIKSTHTRLYTALREHRLSVESIEGIGGVEKALVSGMGNDGSACVFYKDLDRKVRAVSVMETPSHTILRFPKIAGNNRSVWIFDRQSGKQDTATEGEDTNSDGVADK